MHELAITIILVFLAAAFVATIITTVEVVYRVRRMVKHRREQAEIEKEAEEIRRKHFGG